MMPTLPGAAASLSTRAGALDAARLPPGLAALQSGADAGAWPPLPELASVPTAPQRIEGQRYVDVALDDAVSDTDFVACHFERVVWRGPARRVRFIDCRFEQVRFEACRFEDVGWERCGLEGCAVVQVQWQQVRWIDTRAQDMRVQDCVIARLTAAQCAWLGWTIERSTLRQWVACGCELPSLSIERGTMRDTSWAECTFSRTRYADLALDRHIAARSTFDGLELQRCSGINDRWIDCELREAVYVGCRLAQCAWSLSRWRGGLFSHCTLDTPGFDGAELTGIGWDASPSPRAQFDHARLTRCELVGQQMPGLSLRSAKLAEVDLGGLVAPKLDAVGAELTHVRVDGADLREARLHGQAVTGWPGARLDGARFAEPAGLDDTAWRARHRPGPRKIP